MNLYLVVDTDSTPYLLRAPSSEILLKLFPECDIILLSLGTPPSESEPVNA